MTITLLKNVRLEVGFKYENDFIIGTKTDVFDIEIEKGTISNIGKELPEHQKKVIDAQENILLPALREMHIHIDKTYYGGKWISCTPMREGILTRLKEEERLLPTLLPTVKERSVSMIEELIAQGHTHIRTHCNVDPIIGTKHIEYTLEVLEKYQDKLSYEVVAFPQQGLLRSHAKSLMTEAMKMGATLVGGVDPATIDRNIDKSLDTMMDIAITANAGLDIHMHDADNLGAFQMLKLVELTKQAKKEGAVTISHAMALAHLPQAQLDEVIDALKSSDIDITSTVPFNRETVPIPYLDKQGLKISLGHDSFMDHWSPFGNGNTIEKLAVLAERFRVIDEYSLSRLWRYVSGFITPLNDEGERIWPQKGDRANVLLLDAESSAHAIARRRSISHVLYEGKLTHQASQEGR